MEKNKVKKFDTDQNVDKLKLPYFILAVSMILTFGITYIFYQSAVSKDKIRFETNVSRIHNTIEERIGLYIVLLKSGRGFIEANQDFKRKDFANFVKSLELEKNYKGVQGIGYSKVFGIEEKQSVIDQMKADGFADFRIFPETGNSTIHSILYIEPLNERNRQAIGYDMSTEPNRLTALNSAAQTGQATATSQITLIQETSADFQKGFLIYLPIYESSESSETQTPAPDKLRGFIYSPFRAGNFLAEVHKLTNISDLNVKIYDGEVAEENVLAQSELDEKVPSTPTINKQITSLNNVNVAGRNWIVEYETLPSFNLQSNVGWAPFIFLGGVTFSLMVFGLTYWEASAREKVQKIAEELYESENQKLKFLQKEQEARRAAENANRAKDEFISVISHELRTPLNAIAGWARILRASHLTETKRQSALEKIDKNLRHQTHLIEDMISYSQMVSDSSGMKFQKFKVSEVFDEVFENFRLEAIEKNINFEKKSNLNGCILNGDKEKIRILLGNLISNAVKFTPDGGHVEADLEEDKSKIKICIKDDGIGIDKDFLPYIFDQFRQADSTTTRKHGGVGLGLAISKHIVRLHDGTIEAESKGEGKGTIVTVKIPLDKEKLS